MASILHHNLYHANIRSISAALLSLHNAPAISPQGGGQSRNGQRFRQNFFGGRMMHVNSNPPCISHNSNTCHKLRIVCYTKCALHQHVSKYLSEQFSTDLKTSLKGKMKILVMHGKLRISQRNLVPDLMVTGAQQAVNDFRIEAPGLESSLSQLWDLTVSKISIQPVLSSVLRKIASSTIARIAENTAGGEPTTLMECIRDCGMV